MHAAIVVTEEGPDRYGWAVINFETADAAQEFCTVSENLGFETYQSVYVIDRDTFVDRYFPE